MSSRGAVSREVLGVRGGGGVSWGLGGLVGVLRSFRIG